MALPRTTRRALALAAAATLLSAGLVLYGPAALASSSTSLTPTADGYVDSTAANSNFAGSTQLRIDGSPVVRTYLRFDLRGLSGSVTSAHLELFAESPSGIGYMVSRTDGTSWSESSLTWNSKPDVGSAIGNSEAFSANTWTQVDVTSAVTAGGFVDFAVDSRNTTAIKFASDDSTGGSAEAKPGRDDEHDAADAADPAGSLAPQLVVTICGGATAAPTESPTAGPSESPTATPTSGSTSSPTATPTALPTSAPTATATPTAGPTTAPTAAPSQSATGGFEIIAGGDTRTNVSGIQATAALIKARPNDPVLSVGDDTADGTTAEYASFYNPAYGPFKSRIHPVPGNHEYNTAGGAGYFAYWGAQAGTAGQGWYSFNLPNNWHVIALNAEVNHAAGSPQELFLKSDLAANAGKHIIAFWHQARFTSCSVHSSDPSFAPFWNDLYAAHADLVFNGDDHQYERFALQNPSGVADPNGIREFVVGMGGAPLYGFATILPNSQVHYNGSWGILVLTLNAHSYSWQFVPVAGHTFTDTGTQATHS
jgi:acid phosphatase type 7